MNKRNFFLYFFISLLAINCFLLVGNSHAITITGSETITTNSSASYSADGCDGTVSWGVTGTGASISSNGVLTTGSASCGAITVTARCSDGTIEKKEIRVTDAGYWLTVSDCSLSPSYWCWNGWYYVWEQENI